MVGAIQTSGFAADRDRDDVRVAADAAELPGPLLTAGRIHRERPPPFLPHRCRLWRREAGHTGLIGAADGGTFTQESWLRSSGLA
jgi:hypothetical protein